jgi:hypothetical protein
MSQTLLAPKLLVFGLVFALFGSASGLSQQSQSSNEVTVAQSGPADQPTQPGTPTLSTRESDVLIRPTAHGRRGPELLSNDQLAKEIAAQKRVATYFHDKVTPRLKSCWDSLKGTGDIRMEYTFARRDKNWMPEKVILAHSTVPEDQNDAALECMQGAVKDAPLPIDYGDADTKDFFISWSWPVPTPKDAEQHYQMMVAAKPAGGGGGGCDGRGTSPRCKRCVGEGACSSCATVCVGYQSCGFSYSPKGKLVGCFNDPPTQCVSGGSGGVSGGLVIY